MHETMVRLYQAAKELKGIDGRGAQSEIARLLDASPQQIKNWESRGISSSGMIDASKILGISVSWLKTGQGDICDIQPYPLERLDIYMDTLQERLIHARKQKQMSQAQLGKAIGKSQSAIAALETGRNKASTDIAKIANVLGVSAIWLETGQGEMRETYQLPTKGDVRDIHEPRMWSSNDPLPEDDYVFTPYLKETEFTGGAGSYEIPDYNGFRLPFGKSTLWRKSIMPDNVFCCTLNGDSMEPRIAEDAAIAVDTGIERIRDGKIYAFQHDDLFRVKYLYRLPGNKIRIHSENPDYPDEIVDGEEIRVIGRVFWWSVLD